MMDFVKWILLSWSHLVTNSFCFFFFEFMATKWNKMCIVISCPFRICMEIVMCGDAILSNHKIVKVVIDDLINIGIDHWVVMFEYQTFPIRILCTSLNSWPFGILITVKLMIFNKFQNQCTKIQQMTCNLKLYKQSNVLMEIEFRLKWFMLFYCYVHMESEESDYVGKYSLFFSCILT